VITTVPGAQPLGGPRARAVGHGLPRSAGVFWISGDTVLYEGSRRVTAHLQVDVVLLHLGAVRFGVT
jgi:hypothetical protein